MKKTFLAGGGEMGARMRDMDWSRTGLGPLETWPQSLRSTVSMLLPSKAQIILFWGPEFIVLYNDAYRPVFGAKHPDVLGHPGREAWSEIWDTQLHALLDDVVKTGEAFWARDLLFVLERHGFIEDTYFDVSYDPVRVESGAVGGVFCIVTETTERVVGQRRLALLRDLAASNATARTTREACRLAMDTLAGSPDLAFALVYLNNELQAGTPDAEAQLAATPPEMIKTVAIPASAGEGGGDRMIIGVNPRRPFDDGYRTFMELVADQVATAVVNARAYEAERQRADELAAIDRAKTTFFSNISHEFRTPLTLLVSPLEDVLASTTALPPDHAENLQVAHRNALRLLRLVNTLLDFSRIEAGRIDANYEPADLAALTTDLASAFRSAVEKAGLTLVLDCPALPHPVYVDRDMWEKIVLNLLSNAFKFTFEGEIRVELRWRDDHVELRVSDTGVGISADDLERVFERFHRLKHERARTHEGSGIGLALVQELARLHGGTVVAESEAGRGSTFTVSIPTGKSHLPSERISTRHQLPPTTTGATPYVEEALRWLPETSPLHSPLAEPLGPALSAADPTEERSRILIADDNADMRAYLARILGQRHHVVTVGDGRAALERIRADRPDLVLTDVMMPELDGFGLLEAIRANPQTRQIPVLLLSARAGEEARIEALRAGANEYLVKPFSARELVACVQSQLQLARLRRETEHHLIEANRIKDDFLATLSHELRTPLNAILGWSQMLRTGALRPDAQQRGLQSLERNAKAQAKLVDDLLDVSRIMSGKLQVEREPFDLTAVIAAAVDAIRPLAAARNLALRVGVDGGSEAIVEGDAGRIQQVVSNLLSNAVKFTPAGGSIDVDLREVDGQHELVVRDSGEGIDPVFLPHVFDRFWQADNTKTRKHGGLGLGLAIARHLTEAHGGTVSVRSDGPGSGATFTVRLPRVPQHLIARASATTPTVAPNVLSGLRVLIVDNDRDACELAKVVVENSGAQAVVAESGAQALRILEDEGFHVIVADIGMPDQDGYSLMRSIRSRLSTRGGSIRALALSALTSPRDRADALAAGFDGHLGKPAEPDQLLAVIASLTKGF